MAQHQHQHQNGSAGAHGKHGRVHHQDLTYFFPKLISALRWGQREENVLDYGCGPGETGFHYILPELLKYNSKLYSVDVNETKVEHAKQDYPHESVTYAVGNIMEEPFPFKDVQFDKIFSIYVFHCVHQLSAKEALRRLHSILKPGGQLTFTIHKTYWFQVIKTLGEMEKWKEFAVGYDDNTSEFERADQGQTAAIYEKVLKEAGFKLLMTDAKDMEQTFDDVDDIMKKRVVTLPFYDKVPENLREDLLEDFRAVILEIAGLSKDTQQFIYRYRCIAFVAEKAE